MNLKLISALIFTIGILDSVYLLYEHYLLYSLPYCPINSCIPLLELPFPSFILPLLGLLWLFLGTFLFYIGGYKPLLRFWQASGVFGVVVLFSYSLLIGYFCPYCYLAHACGLLLVVLSLRISSLKS